MRCKNCYNNKLNKVFKIGKQPISSVFFKEKKFKLKKYSLDLYKCKSCDLVQFSKLPPLDDMYGLTYGYNTSLSPLMVEHMKNKYREIKKKYPDQIKKQILDIGSNDGTFLNFFHNTKKKNLFGIDPSSKKFLKNYKKNINVTVDFFSKKNLKKSLSKSSFDRKFGLVTSFAMFYDIENPNSFCRDIFQILEKNGLWILEFSYLPLLFKNLTYDQICHEHVTYYSLITFEKILKNNGMKIIDLSFNEINGGSIEVVCAKNKSKHKVSSIVKETIQNEKKILPNIFNLFQNRVDNIKTSLKEILKNIKSKDIVAYGASTKGNIVLNHLNLTNKNISYICDANEFKYNRYAPGSNIKIISKKEMRKLKPKYLLVLIWSFRKEVIKQEIDYLKNGGTMIFHLPMIHFVNKSNYKTYLKNDFTGMSYAIA